MTAGSVTILLPAPVKSPGMVAFVPSRAGATLKAADSFGNMFVSNWVTREATCASVTCVDAAPRQSPAGKAASFATHTSMLCRRPAACSPCGRACP